eukprot:scaffold3342_cov174-Amphora_coffeaeformis.AAC.12
MILTTTRQKSLLLFPCPDPITSGSSFPCWDSQRQRRAASRDPMMGQSRTQEFQQQEADHYFSPFMMRVRVII